MRWPTPIPRGAVAVVALGLALSALSHLLETETTGADEINYAADQAIPPAAATTSAGSLRIADGQIATTRANAGGAGYHLFRVAAVFRAAPPAGATLRGADCTIRVAGNAIVARTPNRRASYPRPSDRLTDQEVSAAVYVEFNSSGSAVVVAPLDDALGRFIHGGDATVVWGEYRPTAQSWLWRFQARPGAPVSVGFASYWRSQQEERARVACSARTDAGAGRVSTSGRLELSGVD